MGLIPLLSETKKTIILKQQTDFLEVIQSRDDEKCNRKTGTLDTTFHKSSGKENLYVQFGYAPQKIYNHSEDKFQSQ